MPMPSRMSSSLAASYRLNLLKTLHKIHPPTLQIISEYWRILIP
jgi:hypothetical protein